MESMDLMLDHLEKDVQKAAQAAAQANIDDGKQSKLCPQFFLGGCSAFLMHTERAAALPEVLPTPIMHVCLAYLCCKRARMHASLCRAKLMG